MNPTVLFLQTLGQTLAAHALYAEQHPMRSAARDRAYAALVRVLEQRGQLRISFLDGAVLVGSRVLPELRGWEWGAKLAAAGIQRFEVDVHPMPSVHDLSAFISQLTVRISAGSEGPSAATLNGFRYGALSVSTHTDSATESASSEEIDELIDTLALIPLTSEAAVMQWIHERVASGGDVPFAEVEVVVSSLAMAMGQGTQRVLPLLDIVTHDQYATAHACNVATLAIGVAEQLGLSSDDAKAIGIAAMVHDIGNTKVPRELLERAGPLNDVEFAEVQRHTVEGARLLSARGRGNALAATVAYEHHRWENGQGGYPQLHWLRRSHFASRLVRVCDMYDAMRTERPYRAALSSSEALRYLQERSGIEVQGEIVQALVDLLTETPTVRTPMDAAQAPMDWTLAPQVGETQH